MKFHQIIQMTLLNRVPTLLNRLPIQANHIKTFHYRV